MYDEKLMQFCCSFFVSYGDNVDYVCVVEFNVPLDTV